MTKYVVFLRGINVGGRIIKMADLKACFEKRGFYEVETFLQSGNVVFASSETAAKLKPLLESTLSEAFNYPAKVQVFSLEKLRAIVEAFPFGEAGPKQHNYVIFFENNLEQAIMQERYELGPGEQVQAGDGVVYWRVDQGQTLRSLFGKTLTKVKYKTFNTNRNLKTLRKIIDVAT